MNELLPKGITIKQLKAFAAVAQTHSFAEACGLVHLSQPALSIAIKNLEEGVGGRLLQRSTRSVTLTPEGEEFYKVVLRLLSDWDQALTDINNRFTLQQGKLNMAAMPSFASSILPLALKQYRLQYPDINIAVDDVVAEQVVALVRSGRVELGVTFEPREAQDLRFESLFSDKFIAVLPAGHDLLKHKKIKWQALQSYDFIALQKPSSVRMLIEQSLQKAGAGALTPAFEAHQLTSIGRMVVSGLGVSAVPALTQKHMLEMGAECRPLVAPDISRNVGIISRRRHTMSLAAQAMKGVLKNH